MENVFNSIVSVYCFFPRGAVVLSLLTGESLINNINLWLEHEVNLPDHSVF
jgi:hypothetical protein